MSLLPSEILPQTTPLGRVLPDGRIQIAHNWWLLLYNLCNQILGPQLDASALQAPESVDEDVGESDTAALRSRIDAYALLAQSDALPESVDPRALLLALDLLLPDSVPAAQPVASITVGASPFAYTARFDGTVSVTSGTVSSITITRQGTTVATGLTAGLFPVRRLDQLTVTYTVAPTMVFLP